MIITVNGRTMDAAEQMMLSDLLLSCNVKPGVVIVVVNEMVVKQAMWSETKIADGDSIELVSFIGGG
ncbi:MAG: thiamine biosynthesis protein ThiS [Syntrophus sp. (in: bacteria)]|nr:thiamine biosynthesis protein ThiS [Syntrophus sp. (in: bacteria)]